MRDVHKITDRHRHTVHFVSAENKRGGGDHESYFVIYGDDHHPAPTIKSLPLIHFALFPVRSRSSLLCPYWNLEKWNFWLPSSQIEELMFRLKGSFHSFSSLIPSKCFFPLIWNGFTHNQPFGVLRLDVGGANYDTTIGAMFIYYHLGLRVYCCMPEVSFSFVPLLYSLSRLP